MAEGGSVRALAGNLLATLGLEKLLGGGPAEKQVAFTMALIALCAKLSKADGVTLRIEADAFEDIMHVPEQERANVRRFFDLAKQDVAGFDIYARRLARLLANEPDLRCNVLHALFHIALADRLLHDKEEAYLRYVAEAFGCDEMEYRAVRALFVRDEDDPYVILGVVPDCSDDELKAAWRRLVRQYHPDTLISQGVPDAFVEIANEKMRVINLAYERATKERSR
ncbi:MAG: hypothetical protein RLZ98_107 [Pseudomonadota bacterium]